VAEIQHSELGNLKTLFSPPRLSLTPADLTRAPPVLGQHTREILVELGYSDEEVEALLKEGAVRGPGSGKRLE
ncbi:MAG: CoA transferase, partial [Thermoprotei archaeon]